MPFLKNNQFNEIYNASKEGNQKALEIMQAMRKNVPQNDLDRMVGEYYDVGNVEPLPQDEILPEEEINVTENIPQENNGLEIDAGSPEEETESVISSPSLSSALDKDFDGIIDENEINDTAFSDFLKNKHRDGERSRKNSEYFKAYSPEDREAFMQEKIGSYKNKFNNRLKDIDRRYRDMDGAIGLYSQKMNETLDDDNPLDLNVANDAYNDITGNEDIMHGFGRSWDEEDTNSVIDSLRELITKYGKKNVIAALNTLKNDNANYRDYLNNQVDSEIGRYSKSIESLLK